MATYKQSFNSKTDPDGGILVVRIFHMLERVAKHHHQQCHNAIANQKGGWQNHNHDKFGNSIGGLRKKSVVDIDAKGNASTGLGIPANERDISIYDALIYQTPIETTIKSTIVES